MSCKLSLKKTILVTLTGIGLLASLHLACKKYYYTEFTDEDLQWLIYSEGQQLKFMNQNGDQRHYTAFNLVRGYLKEGTKYDALYYNYFKWNDDTLNQRGDFRLDKKGGGTNIFFSWPRLSGKAYLHLLPSFSDTIAGTYYSDLRLILTSALTATHNIDSLYYSKTMGPVRFTDSDGNEWIRQY
jgi:hypothetical protein